jgi:hypothetical protein
VQRSSIWVAGSGSRITRQHIVHPATSTLGLDEPSSRKRRRCWLATERLRPTAAARSVTSKPVLVVCANVHKSAYILLSKFNEKE